MNAGRIVAHVAALGLACLFAACGGHEDEGGLAVARPASATAAPPAERRAAGGYRVLGTPLVFIDDAADRAPGINIIVRFNRRLRRDRIDGEGVGADFRLAGAGSLDSAPGALGKPARHCYIGYFGNDAATLKDPRAGQRTRLTIEIFGVKRHLLVPATLRGPAEQRALTEALCGRV